MAGYCILLKIISLIKSPTIRKIVFDQKFAKSCLTVSKKCGNKQGLFSEKRTANSKPYLDLWFTYFPVIIFRRSTFSIGFKCLLGYTSDFPRILVGIVWKKSCLFGCKKRGGINRISFPKRTIKLHLLIRFLYFSILYSPSVLVKF